MPISQNGIKMGDDMASEMDFSSAIEKIIKNPEFADMVKELRGSEETKSGEDISAEMLARLPDVLSAVKPLIGDSNTDNNDKANNSKTSSNNETMDVKAGHESPSNRALFGEKSYDKAKAEKLLVALKPYLSKSRCGIIDKCLSIMQIYGVMGVLGSMDERQKNNP